MTALDPTRNGGRLDLHAWSPSVTEQVETDPVLRAILDGVAVPVCVVDHQGLVVLANPAALDVLGFDGLSDLQGRHGDDAVHSMHPDGAPFPAEDCLVLELSRTSVPVQP